MYLSDNLKLRKEHFFVHFDIIKIINSMIYYFAFAMCAHTLIRVFRIVDFLYNVFSSFCGCITESQLSKSVLARPSLLFMYVFLVVALCFSSGCCRSCCFCRNVCIVKSFNWTIVFSNFNRPARIYPSRGITHKHVKTDSHSSTSTYSIFISLARLNTRVTITFYKLRR